MKKQLAITSPKDAVISATSLCDPAHEELWILYLDTQRRPIHFKMMSSGGWSSTVVDARQILREALILRAAAMILFHNHPSGNPTPGLEDIKQTEEIKRAANIMDINLVDHIIIGENCYYSFCEEKVTLEQ